MLAEDCKKRNYTCNKAYIVKCVQMFIDMCQNNKNIWKIEADPDGNLSVIASKSCTSNQIKKAIVGYLFPLNQKQYNALVVANFNSLILCSSAETLSTLKCSVDAK